MTLLVEGSKGQAVRNAQTALNYHLPDAQPPLVVDGIFGRKTKARVLQFQKQTDYLVVDAIIGPRTSEALYTFVDLSFHIVTITATTPARDAGGEAAGMEAVGRPGLFRWPRPGKDWPRIDPPLLPPLPFKFPRAVPPLPRLLQRPRLSFDPLMLYLRKRLSFDLGIGLESSIQKNLTSGEVERDLVVLADGRLTVWSKPIGRHLTFSGGGGLVVEQRLRPTPETSASAYVFAKAEIKDLKKFGPLDIAKIEGGLQFGGALGKRKPPDLTTSVCVGPEVEALKDRLSFGLAGCFDYTTDGRSHAVAGRGALSGTWHF